MGSFLIIKIILPKWTKKEPVPMGLAGTKRTGPNGAKGGKNEQNY